MKDRAIVAMNVPVEIQVEGKKIVIQRDFIIDHDAVDGSKSINVYQAGHDYGGRISVTDPAMVALFDQLIDLFLDPDGFGSRDIGAVLQGEVEVGEDAP